MSAPVIICERHFGQRYTTRISQDQFNAALILGTREVKVADLTAVQHVVIRDLRPSEIFILRWDDMPRFNQLLNDPDHVEAFKWQQ